MSTRATSNSSRDRATETPNPSAFDPRRLRSAGTLDASELALCRKAGIELAYDPIQIGWVTADCNDDIDPDSDHTLAASPGNRSSAAGALLIRFEQRASTLLREADRRARDPDRTRRALWALPEELLRADDSIDPAVCLPLLRSLQARAEQQIHARLGSRKQRAARRHEALMRGRGYLLRPWREDDAPRFHALLDDPRVWEHLPETYPDPLTQSMATALIEISNAESRHEVRAIEREGRVVGQLRMLFAAPDHATDSGGLDAEISYWLGADHWGEGIAGDLIPLYTLLTFRKRPLGSIFARVAEGNTASRRALERAGYRDEGDLAAELGGDAGMRTLRCFRSVYLDQRSTRPPLRRGDWAATAAGVAQGHRAPVS